MRPIGVVSKNETGEPMMRAMATEKRVKLARRHRTAQENVDMSWKTVCIRPSAM